VRELIRRAADETERLVEKVARASDEVAGQAAEPAAPIAPEPGGSGKEPPE
jgi:hypothetical protein